MSDFGTYEYTGRPGPGPLMLALHGTGGDENQLRHLALDLVPEAFLVALRGDVSEGGARRFFRREAEGVYDMADLARRVEKLADFVADLRAMLAGRRALGFGYSNGANIIAATAFTHPDAFDFMVLMHPLIPWEPEPSPGLAGRRVLVTAGRRDPICPASETERLAAWLEAQGADVALAWHDGGHEVAPEEIEAIRAWLANSMMIGGARAATRSHLP